MLVISCAVYGEVFALLVIKLQFYFLTLVPDLGIFVIVKAFFKL